MVTHEIEFKNIELIKLFDGFREEYYQMKKDHGIEDGMSINMKHDSEYYCKKEYLDYIQSTDHIGFPETYKTVNLSQLKRAHPDIWKEYLIRVKNDTASLIGAHTSALSIVYPPEGFVGWHTNHNSPSYQILFTWSESGEGYFRYQDNKTKKIVTLKDKPGWNVRHHYFGSEHEPDLKLWHCAYTECDRFSFAYKYVGHKSKFMFEAALYEISTP